jgi:DNA-binding CsgD family transcriptional regulator
MNGQNEVSTRERQILERAMEGMTDKEIACDLGISPATVKSYWLRIRQKVGGLTRTEAVARVLQQRHSQGGGEASVALEMAAGGVGDPLEMARWWQSVCEFSGFAAMFIAPDGTIRGCTRCPDGICERRILGHSMVELLVPRCRRPYRHAVQAVRSSLRPERLEVTVECPDSGVHVDLAGRLAPIREGSVVLGYAYFLE